MSEVSPDDNESYRPSLDLEAESAESASLSSGQEKAPLFSILSVRNRVEARVGSSADVKPTSKRVDLYVRREEASAEKRASGQAGRREASERAGGKKRSERAGGKKRARRSERGEAKGREERAGGKKRARRSKREEANAKKQA